MLLRRLFQLEDALEPLLKLVSMCEHHHTRALAWIDQFRSWILSRISKTLCHHAFPFTVNVAASIVSKSQNAFALSAALAQASPEAAACGIAAQFRISNIDFGFSSGE